MKSSTAIQVYTPAVLEAICRQKGISKRAFRKLTLERIKMEMTELLTEPAQPFHDRDKERLGQILDSVRLALGNE